MQQTVLQQADLRKKVLAFIVLGVLILFPGVSLPGVSGSGPAHAYQAVCIDCGFIFGGHYCARWYRDGFARCILGSSGFVCWGTCTLQFIVSE